MGFEIMSSNNNQSIDRKDHVHCHEPSHNLQEEKVRLAKILRFQRVSIDFDNLVFQRLQYSTTLE